MVKPSVFIQCKYVVKQQKHFLYSVLMIVTMSRSMFKIQTIKVVIKYYINMQFKLKFVGIAVFL